MSEVLVISSTEVELLETTPAPIELLEVAVQGTQGIQGIQGIQGVQGEQGEQGVPGTSSVTWDTLTGKPATFPATAHDHTISEVTGLTAALAAKVDTVAGMGLSENDFTDAQVTKLAGIATAATANSADATLLARANHTGVQAISTITGLQAALDAGASWDTLTGKPSTFPPDAHAHPISDVTGLTAALAAKVDAVAGMGLSENDFTDAQVTKLAGIATGATANSADATLLARANHTGVQAISTVTDLQATLDAKVDGVVGMGLSENDFTDAQVTKLAGIATGATANSADATLLARANHTGEQAIGTVTGLQGAIDTKADLASPTLTGTPAAPTAALNTNTTQLATTAFVVGQAATVVSPPAGSAAVGTSLTYARQDHVHASDSTKANLAGPAFTGVPTAPTASVNSGSTQIATTAFVIAQIADDAPTKTGSGASGLWPITVAQLGSYDGGTLYGTTNLTAVSRSNISAPSWYLRTVSLEFKDRTALTVGAGFTGNYTGLLTIAPNIGTSASGFDPTYQLAFSPSAANTTTLPDLKFRAGIDSAWGTWYTMVHSGNYATVMTGTASSLTAGSANLLGGTLEASVSSATPNATIPASKLTPNNAATSVDLVLSPKLNGSVLVQTPDSATTGGNKRGTNAVDFQFLRTANTHVAGGARAIVLNGENNRASGVDSAAGGMESVTAADYSFAFGSYCSANGTYSIAMGNSATAASSASVALSGQATGISSFAIVGGTTGADYSMAFGQDANTYTVKGKRSFGCTGATGGSSGTYVAQSGRLLIAAVTANATLATLTYNGSATSTTNQLLLRNAQAMAFTGLVVARQQTAASTVVAAWKVEGLINRGANAAATVLVASTVTAISNAPGWTLALRADTTNGTLAVDFTGAAATAIRVVCELTSTEVVYV